MRKFINGRLEGTNLEIMPSPAATTLPDGTPIRQLTLQGMNTTQLAAAAGDIDVHERQVVYIGSELDSGPDGEYYRDVVMLGPTIAQQWKNEYNAKLTQRGWTARYYNEGRA